MTRVKYIKNYIMIPNEKIFNMKGINNMVKTLSIQPLSK